MGLSLSLPCCEPQQPPPIVIHHHGPPSQVPAVPTTSVAPVVIHHVNSSVAQSLNSAPPMITPYDWTKPVSSSYLPQYQQNPVQSQPVTPMHHFQRPQQLMLHKPQPQANFQIPQLQTPQKPCHMDLRNPEQNGHYSIKNQQQSYYNQDHVSQQNLQSSSSFTGSQGPSQQSLNSASQSWSIQQSNAPQSQSNPQSSIFTNASQGSSNQKLPSYDEAVFQTKEHNVYQSITQGGTNY